MKICKFSNHMYLYLAKTGKYTFNKEISGITRIIREDDSNKAPFKYEKENSYKKTKEETLHQSSVHDSGR